MYVKCTYMHIKCTTYGHIYMTTSGTMGVRLVVGLVQESIDRGTAREEPGPNASRNALQSVTLLETIEREQFDACLGGGRRDEEKARAKGSR